MRCHNAVSENPAYFDSIKTIAEVTEQIVSPPITDQELENLASADNTIYSYAGPGSDIVEARRQYEADFQNRDKPEVSNFDTMVDFMNQLADVFIPGYGAGYSAFVRDSRDMESYLSRRGIKDPIRHSSAGLLLTHTASPEDPSLSMPNFEGATSYMRAFQVISGRLATQAAQCTATLALANDRHHELLVRAQDGEPEESKRNSLGTFIEGFETILHAGSHLELGGAEDMRDSQQFAKAILDYTRNAPKTGIIAPAARLGHYFHNFTDRRGTLNAPYREYFEETRKANREFFEMPGLPYDWDGVDVSNSPLAYIPRDVGTFLRKDYRGRPVTPYSGEGCPAAYYRIVHSSAQLFMDKVLEISCYDSDLTVAPLDFNLIVDDSQQC